MKVTFLTAVFLLFPAVCSAEDVVAVFGIEAKGLRLKNETLESLTNYLSTELASVPGFQVVPRDAIKAQVAAAKKESYKACYDQACQIEIGKELAAQKSLSAQILKIGSTCVLTLSLIDLRKSATERAATHEGRCTEDALLTAVRTAVEKLGRTSAAVPPNDATRCEIVLGPEGCPASGAIDQKSFDDNHENAGSDRARCLKRGWEWFSFCGVSSGVTVRYYQGTKILAEERVAPPSRCEITFGAEKCPGNGLLGSVVNDDFDGSATNPERCKKRTAEYVIYCGISGATGRYYSGDKLVDQITIAPRTRCQITLGEERCPSQPHVQRVFNDDWDGAAINEARCLRRAEEYHTYCASKSEVLARYYSGAQLQKEKREAPASRCEISLAEKCAGNPGLNLLFNDRWQGAESSEERCRKRALEYFYHCGTGGAATARFYSGGKLIREERAHPGSRCEITLGSERCPKDPNVHQIFNDDWDGAGSNQARCMQRAAEFVGYCGSKTPVNARYYAGGSLVKETEARP